MPRAGYRCQHGPGRVGCGDHGDGVADPAGRTRLLAVAVLVLISKVLVKLVVVAVIVVLAGAVYSQRAELADCPRTCSCSFFGYSLEIGSETVNDACQDVVSRVRAAVD